jgi:hypothetical protein
MKNLLTDQVQAKVEEAWLQQWSEWLGRPTGTPGKVMHTYLEYMDITVDDLDAQMCWDCWPKGDDMEEIQVLNQK